ncbi:aminotransferase class V-fold PLP-dependent enzyme [Sulfuriflexus mobilis]|uniref:aminotransferase class V-fold PLP-dependent enzyme n=1 Tax=Sulfuriflexus mobilis TaxID=1811807 RepID=UPI000F83DD0C|nr:aminotransferase class V-fold PLP-dependent enzyme [Sulfuriflexus mobilis]
MLNEFPLDNDLVYLNHAAVAPWPQRTADAINQFTDENLHHGARYYPRWMETELALRGQLVSLLNAASVDDIALVKNTSEALSMVAHGLDWQPGDNVVFPDIEFPSNRIVWESLARYGVEIRKIDIRRASTPEEALIEAMDDNTRLLATSSVQYATGLRMDLERLGRACRARPHTLFCVDAIQSLGALAMDVEAIHADFVMADGHKWLLAPEGLAVFYSRETARNVLKNHEFGWHMVEEMFAFDNPDWKEARSARRFECGSPNMLGIHALHASLSLLLETGMEDVSARILANTDYLLRQLQQIPGMQIITPEAPGQHAGIVTFCPPVTDISALHGQLMESGVICALRGGGIRFSPHFYTQTQQLDRALQTLKTCMG